jgi:hypothetical protein
MVALWSKESDWVAREVGKFEGMTNPSGEVQMNPDRRLIFVNLQGRNSAYASTQSIDYLVESDAYTKGIANLDKLVWDKIIDHIVTPILDKDSALPVPLAILSMTNDSGKNKDEREVEQLPAATWKKVSEDLGRETEDLKSDYGTTRTDWRPFGAQPIPKRRKIIDILEGLLNDVNSDIIPKLKNTRFRWDPVSEDWSTAAKGTQNAGVMAAQPSVIVVDPISLYHREIKTRLSFLRTCLKDNENCTVLVLPPFSVSVQVGKLRELVRDSGAPLLDPYFQPVIPPEISRARCGINLGENEIKPLLMNALGQYMVAVSAPPTKSLFLAPPR